MKKPKSTTGSGHSEGQKISSPFTRGTESALTKTYFNAKVQKLTEAAADLPPDQRTKLIKLLMQSSPPSRPLPGRRNTYTDYYQKFMDDALAEGYIPERSSQLDSGSRGKELLPRLPVLVEGVKSRQALSKQEILERLRQGAPQTILPTEAKDEIRKGTYVKQPRAAEMSDKIQKSIASGELPGEFIFRELIEPSGQTLRFIAKKIDVHHMSLSHLKAGRMSLSGEMAAKLSHHFRTHSTLKHTYSTQELLSLQSAIDAKKADQSLQKQLASPPEEKDPTPA